MTRNGHSRLRSCTPADIPDFEARDKIGAIDEVYDWREGMIGALQVGWFYVFEPEGYPMAIGGAWPIHHGVAEWAVVVSPGIERYAKSFVRACKEALDNVRQDHGVWRAQARIRCSDHRGRRFAEAFGFQIEGVMEQFGPDGSDYYLMAKIWGRDE